MKEEEKDQVENNQMNTDQPTKVTSTFPWESYSSFTKLIRHVALMKLLVRKWKSKTQSCIKLKSAASLLQKSRTAIFELVQRENFASELKYPQVSNVVSNQSKLLQLNPILDKSLIKVGGLLKHVNIPNQSKHQIILPAKHQVTSLIIQHYHETSYHSGRDQTLSLICQSYWIVNGKSAVRKILQRCLYCKRKWVQPQPPIIANLADERVGLYEPAFSYTGIDFFGPLVVKYSKRTRTAQTRLKSYGAVFVCLTAHTIHLDLVGDLSTDSFFLTLIRFMARRVKPKTIWTDNGTNFISPKRELSI